MPTDYDIVSDFTQDYNRAYMLLNTYYAEAYRDVGFYLGNQWSLEQMKYLNEERRNSFTFNKSRKTINMVSGYLSANQMQSVVVSRENSNPETADQLTDLLHTQMAPKGYKVMQKARHNSLVSGVSWVSPWIDYRQDYQNGRIDFHLDNWNDIIWDPFSQRIDLEDSSFLARRKYLGKDVIKSLVPGSERLSYVDKIEAIKPKTGVDIKYDPTPSSFSSIGQFYYGDIKFGVKPSERQGTGSAGLDNEDIFINNVNAALEDGPKNVVITDGKKSVKYPNISKAVGTGLETSDYSKSDVDFYDGEKKIGGLSLKKDNAIYWESADVRFKNEVANLADAITTGKLGDQVSYVPYVDARGNEDKVIIKMYNKKEDKPISGVIVDDLPEQDVQQVIFGNDNVPVAIRSWRPGDFKVEGNTLTITCSKLYVTMDDVIADNAQPILNIRHDKSRRKTRGLRALLQTKKSLFRKDSDDLKGNVVRLKYDSFN